MRRLLVPAALALGLVFALATGMFDAPARAGAVIGLDAVKAGLADGSIVLVDVREADEFAAGHVAGAINMPLSRFDPVALPQPEGKTVVVMCRSGRRSGLAQTAAVKAGRSDVLDYSGSMNDWLAKGQPLVTGR